MSALNKEAVKRAKEALKKFNSEIKVIELEQTARTANDAANSLNTEVGSIVKSLLFRNEGHFFLCLVSGDKRCSLYKFKKILKILPRITSVEGRLEKIGRLKNNALKIVFTDKRNN